jgi:hypothetical protein
MIRARPSIVALCLAASCFVAPRVHAQNATGAATDLFNAGRDLMKAGDYAAACPKLAESARLEAKVGTLARLAECEEKLGHMVSARAQWEQAMNLAAAQRDDRLAHVKAELARIDSVVPKVLFAVDGQPPQGLELRIDALQVGLASIGVPLPVEAGSHHLVATAPGKKAWASDISTPPNGSVTRVVVPMLTDGPPEAPPPTTPLGPAPTHASPLGTVGIVVAGAGVIGLGVGAAFGFIASHKNSESNVQPGGCNSDNVCPEGAYGLRNSARTAGDVSTALFVAGGVLVAGGAALWILAPKHTASTTVGLTPVVGPHSGTLMLRASF